MNVMSDNQCRFLLENKDLEILFPGGEIITFEEDGFLSVGLKIGSKTTRDDIVNAATLLMLWQRRLPEWQGNYSKDFCQPKTMELYNRENLDNKRSYHKISIYINSAVTHFLNSYVLFIEEIEKQKFITTGDYIKWISENGRKTLPYVEGVIELRQMRYFYNYFCDILTDISSDPDWSAETMALWIKEIMDGQTPYTEDYPVSTTQVKNALERWRRINKLNPDSPLEENQPNEIIPPIFSQWNIGSKLQWGLSKTEFIDDPMNFPFDILSLTDPFGKILE